MFWKKCWRRAIILAANNPAMLFSGLQYHRGRHFNSITAAGRNEAKRQTTVELASDMRKYPRY